MLGQAAGRQPVDKAPGPPEGLIMAACAWVALSLESPRLPTRKQRLSKGREVAQGHQRAMQSRIPHQVCLTRLSSTHTPPPLITGGGPGEPARKSCPGGWLRKLSTLAFIPGPGARGSSSPAPMSGGLSVCSLAAGLHWGLDFPPSGSGDR